jgi:hypothetical protein
MAERGAIIARRLRLAITEVRCNRLAVGNPTPAAPEYYTLYRLVAEMQSANFEGVQRTSRISRTMPGRSTAKSPLSCFSDATVTL